MSDLGRLSVENLSEEQVEALINTRGFRKMLGYTKLADGISVLREEDEIYDSLVNSILKQHSSIKSERSVRQVLELLVQEVEAFTEPLVADGDEVDEELDVDELYVDERGDA